MRYAQTSFVGFGCLLSLLGACSNSGDSNGGTGAPQAGTSATGGSGTTPPKAGTGGNPSAGGAGAKAGSGASGSGTSSGGAGAPGGTAGSGAAGGGAGSTGASDGSGFAMCGKPAEEGTCKDKAPGVYALKTEVDVWWRDENNSPTLYDPGRGKITVYFRGE